MLTEIKYKFTGEIRVRTTRKKLLFFTIKKKRIDYLYSCIDSANAIVEYQVFLPKKFHEKLK